MEPSSSSFPTNTSQQSKTGKGNAEPSPNPARPLTSTGMRQKVVEILASTANGCLQELGYYPGIPARVQELEARNKNWQSENVKLYEDNKRLVETMRVQNENLRLLNAPETERIQRITNLEMENRTLKMQLDQVMKVKSKADHTQLGQDQNYARLHKEYMALTETYNRAYHEIVHLREIIRGEQRINQSQQHQDQMTYQTFQQQQTLRNAQNSSRTTPLGIPHVPTQAQSGPISSQHVLAVRSSTDANPIHAGQQQLRRNEMEMKQNRELQRQYMQLSSSTPSSRRISGNMTSSLNPPTQMQLPLPNSHNQKIHEQSFIPPIANLPTQYQHVRSTQHNSRPNQVPSMEATYNVSTRPVSYPILPSGPSTSQNFWPMHVDTSSNNLSTPTMRIGSTPPAQSPIGQLPPHLTTLSGIKLSNNPQAAQLRSNPDTHGSRPQSSGHVSQLTTISPNETLINSPPTLIAPTPTFPTNVIAVISQPTPFSPSNTPAIRQSPQRNEPANAPVSIPPNLHHSNIGTPNSNSASPLLHPRTMHLKRESMSVDIDWSSDSHKRPRLESPTIDQNTPPPPSPSVPPSTAGQQISMESETKPTHVADNPIEDEEEEVVEVGPDGLRLVEDILEQVYGENRRGEVMCWFCKHRYDNKYTDTPPAPFIDATDQELEQHCIHEHLDAWNQARADV